MCGEHLGPPLAISVPEGSSPHVRGALGSGDLSVQPYGIIPACAGSTNRIKCAIFAPGDHPRMCGEHDHTEPLHLHRSGSSPHVRGALATCLATVLLSGIIPACAGSTWNHSIRRRRRRDHPRMCGEHTDTSRAMSGQSGSSPHVRGARSGLVRGSVSPGIIPACAGSTDSHCRPQDSSRDHPRMCGEHHGLYYSYVDKWGSSPHVRGALGVTTGVVAMIGIIPACAGSTRTPLMTRCMIRDHPRMCGEHCSSSANRSASPGSSPHVRGALPRNTAEFQCRGIIPACAGSTETVARRAERQWDHPRMCGEHVYTADDVVHSKGSSPHVRGAHFENSIIPRKRKDNWLFFIQFRFENFLAFRYLLALLHPFLGVPTKDPSFASLGRLINCNPSQSTGDQSAPYTLKAICCSFLAE